MTEDKIKNLLREADKMATSPMPVCTHLTDAVRRRAGRKRLINVAAPITTAVMLLLALGIWRLTSRPAETTQEQKRIALLEARLQQLQVRTDSTLNLIHQILDHERRQRRLKELKARLASIPHPLEEIRKEADRTAFILVYQADRMYRELNQKDSAVRNYKRVIELFPQTRSAEVAKQRLSEIQNNFIIPILNENSE